MDDGVGSLSRSKKKKTLSFKSQLVQQKAKLKKDGEADSDQEDLESAGRNGAARFRNLLKEYRQSLAELIGADHLALVNQPTKRTVL